MSPVSLIRSSWPWARLHLGLSKAEFGALTPADWDDLLEVWMEKERAKTERENRIVARICLAVNLTIPRSPGSPIPSEDDFMPKIISTENEGADDEALKQAFLAVVPRRQSVDTSTHS